MNLKKNAWWVALLSIVTLIIAGGIFWLSQSSLLAIEDIEVVGNIDVPTETIVDTAAPLLRGQSLLNPPLDRAADALVQQPLIESVEFERSFPHTLRLRIREYRPALNLRTAGDVVYLVATDGTVLMQVEGDDPSLPTLKTAEPCGELEAGAAPGCEDAQDGISFLVNIPVSFNYQFAVVTVDNGMIRASTHNGVQVMFGTLDQYDFKFEVLRQMLARAYAADARITIDVSVPERPVTRQGDGNATPNPDGEAEVSASQAASGSAPVASTGEVAVLD
ncbi:cell division protein FtsQ [bacterium BMS3Abin01]|nr:cell division protein FtsQ [bacterium BMS3Abin01]HDY69990.1 FtsQ-type POTRA domain-containing protein [Actinomycetota bacterium]